MPLAFVADLPNLLAHFEPPIGRNCDFIIHFSFSRFSKRRIASATKGGIGARPVSYMLIERRDLWMTAARLACVWRALKRQTRN
jgi:hypothetical protein